MIKRKSNKNIEFKDMEPIVLDDNDLTNLHIYMLAYAHAVGDDAPLVGLDKVTVVKNDPRSKDTYVDEVFEKEDKNIGYALSVDSRALEEVKGKKLYNYMTELTFKIAEEFGLYIDTVNIVWEKKAIGLWLIIEVFTDADFEDSFIDEETLRKLTESSKNHYGEEIDPF